MFTNGNFHLCCAIISIERVSPGWNSITILKKKKKKSRAINKFRWKQEIKWILSINHHVYGWQLRSRSGYGCECDHALSNFVHRDTCMNTNQINLHTLYSPKNNWKTPFQDEITPSNKFTIFFFYSHMLKWKSILNRIILQTNSYVNKIVSVFNCEISPFLSSSEKIERMHKIEMNLWKLNIQKKNTK